jgi:hypothetical protein
MGDNPALAPLLGAELCEGGHAFDVEIVDDH